MLLALLAEIISFYFIFNWIRFLTPRKYLSRMNFRRYKEKEMELVARKMGITLNQVNISSLIVKKLYYKFYVLHVF